MSIIVRNIVGRCHVSETNREVIRYVISRMKAGYSTFRQLPKARRRELLQQIIAEHRDNRQLFHSVMTGVF